MYKFKNSEDDILYVGKAINLRNRVRQYFNKHNIRSPRLDAMVAKIADVEIIVTDSEVEALILEATLIKKLKPHYNIDLKDDKSYPYIVITNEPFPRVFITRRILQDGSRYYGPYTDVKSMRASLKMIRDIFKIRSCNYFINDDSIRKRKIKVCLDYHIKKCGGPCEGLMSQDIYMEMIREISQLLKGKTSSLMLDLKNKMQNASDEFRFEEAAELRDRMKQLTVYSERQKVVDTDMIDRDIHALAIEGNDACGVVFNVRDGKMTGRKHVYMSGVEDKDEQEVIEQFIERYYLDADDYPREIFIPADLDNVIIIQQWLTQKSGEKIQIVVPKIGEKAKLMSMCKKNAQLLLGELKLQKEKRKEYIPHSVFALQRDLRLSKPPRHIECFDISNIQGTDSVGAMVVFKDGKPKKSEYRKYKIKSVQGSDDFASIREVVERRYRGIREGQGEYPDLVVIDGGKGQLSSAIEVLEHQGHRAANTEPRNLNSSINPIHVIGIAKRLDEIFISGSSDPLIIPKTSSGLRLLQRIRNEAHRFAIAYHRTLRNKRTLQTELDLIKGVGKKRAKELLETFGSVQGVKFATIEQLNEVVGESLAAKIKDYFLEE